MWPASWPVRSAHALHLAYIQLAWKQKRPTELFTNSLLCAVATGRNLANRCKVFLEGLADSRMSLLTRKLAGVDSAVAATALAHTSLWIAVV